MYYCVTPLRVCDFGIHLRKHPIFSDSKRPLPVNSLARHETPPAKKKKKQPQYQEAPGFWNGRIKFVPNLHGCSPVHRVPPARHGERNGQPSQNCCGTSFVKTPSSRLATWRPSGSLHSANQTNHCTTTCAYSRRKAKLPQQMEKSHVMQTVEVLSQTSRTQKITNQNQYFFLSIGFDQIQPLIQKNFFFF